MNSFTTRIELHTANYDDYVKLHVAMRARGFSQFITSDNGLTYHLPTAEYYISGSFSINTILESAKDAITATGKAGAVLVTEAKGRMWSNLPPYKK